MNTLTLDQLIADAARLKAQFGGHYPTTILELHAQPRVISAEDADSRHQKEILEDAEKREAELEEEIDLLKKESAKADNRIEELESLLSEKDDGKTIMDWKREAEEAKADARQARQLTGEAILELEAMRKRKGVQAGLFRHGQELIRLADDVRLGGKTPGETLWGNAISKKADELLSKIRNTK